MFNAFKMWTAVAIIYYDQNDYSIHQHTDSDDSYHFTAGLEAELLDVETIDISTNPEELLVTASDLATHTGCSTDTARRWLGQLADNGLLKHYPASDDTPYASGLYRPAETDPRTVIRTLHELNDEAPPYDKENLTEVTPSDFHHMTGPRYAYTHSDTDEMIIVDVGEPDGDRSIQQSVLDQLRNHDLIPSSPRNFVHRLRKDADLM